MWCDNCCLILPLRAGALAWAAIIALYSIAGGVFLFIEGPYFFPTYPEWDIYGGISMAVGGAAVVSAFTLSNRNYYYAQAMRGTWPFLIVISAIRSTIMLVRLESGKDNVVWECNNGGQLWPGSTAVAPSSPLPASFCTAGFSTLYTAFIIGLLADLAFQIYMFFLMWRYVRRIEHYDSTKGEYTAVYYSNS